jgi:hypothetical protein
VSGGKGSGKGGGNSGAKETLIYSLFVIPNGVRNF